MFLQKENLMMIHIPKTAGTAISNSIKSAFGNYGNHSHLDIKTYKANISPAMWSPIFKFSFIRCPKERMVSTFKQLVSKRYKKGRDFDEYQTFNPENFNKWIANVWYPHVSGRNIISNDKKMLNWMHKNVLLTKPNGFNPNIYHFYLGDNILLNNNLNLLDFRYCRQEFVSAMKTYQEINKTSIDINKISSNLNEINQNKYSHFWNKNSIDLFNNFNFLDLKFYEAFINKKERGIK